jgi:hypothetical protein
VDVFVCGRACQWFERRRKKALSLSSPSNMVLGKIDVENDSTRKFPDERTSAREKESTILISFHFMCYAHTLRYE